jgi:hypothetical protein
MHPYQQRPRKRDAQPFADEPTQRASREWTDLDTLLAFDRRRQRRSLTWRADTGDVLGAPGEDEADRLGGQPPPSKAQRIVLARSIHGVVDPTSTGPATAKIASWEACLRSIELDACARRGGGLRLLRLRSPRRRSRRRSGSPRAVPGAVWRRREPVSRDAARAAPVAAFGRLATGIAFGPGPGDPCR